MNLSKILFCFGLAAIICARKKNFFKNKFWTCVFRWENFRYPYQVFRISKSFSKINFSKSYFEICCIGPGVHQKKKFFFVTPGETRFPGWSIVPYRYRCICNNVA